MDNAEFDIFDVIDVELALIENEGPLGGGHAVFFEGRGSETEVWIFQGLFDSDVVLQRILVVGKLDGRLRRALHGEDVVKVEGLGPTEGGGDEFTGFIKKGCFVRNGSINQRWHPRPKEGFARIDEATRAAAEIGNLRPIAGNHIHSDPIDLVPVESGSVGCVVGPGEESRAKIL